MANYSSKTALLSRSIDYAGMFPPASLDLLGTLAKAASFRRTARHPWLMNRLVLSLSEFKKLSPRLLFEQGSDGSPWVFSVLGNPSPSSSHSSFVKAIDWDLREIRRVQERYYNSSAQVSAVAYEIKLPDEVTNPGQAIMSGEYIFPALEQIENIWPGELDVYFEVSLEGSWIETLEGVTRIMGEWLSENSDSVVNPALKIRTGGKYVPRPEQLSKAIDECAGFGIKFKATQGLHHPITSQKDFGFINLFVALGFAYSLGSEQFSQADIQSCLSCQDPKSFVFEENQVVWNGKSLTNDEIESARKIHAACFGSCSVDEPDEFLFKEFP